MIKNKIIEVNLCDKYQKTVPIAKRYFLMNEIININIQPKIGKSQNVLVKYYLLFSLSSSFRFKSSEKTNTGSSPVSIKLVKDQKQSFVKL